MAQREFGTSTCAMLVALLLSFAVAGCDRREPESPAADSAADRDAIRAVLRDIEDIYRSGSPRYVDLFDDSPVVTLPGRPPSTDKRAIREFWNEFVGSYDAELMLTNEELIVAGDWAIARNAFELTRTPRAGGEPIRSTGRNQLVFRRQADGSWKLARVIGYTEE